MDSIKSIAEALHVSSPSYWPILFLAGIGVACICIAVMLLAVRLDKRWHKMRTPNEWSRCEVCLVSIFLNAWHLWAVSKHSHNDYHTVFSDKDELHIAFRKFTGELLCKGALNVRYNTDQLMQELLAYDGRDPVKPFGQDTHSVTDNDKRIVFAQLYADKLRSMYLQMN